MRNKTQRTFVPGSSWLYFKIYSGHNTADKILSQKIPAILRQLKKLDRINKWFFIRYADPEPHIRIRFLLKNNIFCGELMELLCKKLNSFVDSSLVWKIQADTYNRELERYGEKLIEEAESIFHLDSECVLSIIKTLNQTQNENHRWMISLKLIDCLLSDFGFDLEKKLQLMNRLSESSKTEFGFNQHNSKQFNTKYRENKDTIEAVLKNKTDDKDYITLYNPIKQRSRKMKPQVKQLLIKLRDQKKKLVSLETLLMSYIHMTLNRLFRSKNRMHELIIYDFMRRYYESEMARSKYNPT